MSVQLPTSKLGRTTVEVTRLGFGAMELRDSSIKWPIEDTHAEILLNRVLDEGITFIDTADCYGRSEDFIGRFISGRRSEFTLATKCGCIPGGRDWTADNLKRGVERSLTRLQTDYVDVVQLHGATPDDLNQEESLEALIRMRDEGKVRWIGASTSTPHIETYTEWGSFDVFQIPYSAFSQENETQITDASKAGMGTIIRGGVAKGHPGEGKGTPDRWALWEKAGLGDLCQEGETPTTFMLRYTLSHPEIDTVIVGTQNLDHIRANVHAASRGPLNNDIYIEAKKRLELLT